MFAPKEIERLRATTLDRAREQIKTAERLGCMAIGPDHPDYPEALTNIDAMPCILYVRVPCPAFRTSLSLQWSARAAQPNTGLRARTAFPMTWLRPAVRL